MPNFSKPQISIPCPRCGRMRKVVKTSNRVLSRLCRECARRAWELDVLCPQCGTLFRRTSKRQQFCSRTCWAEWQNAHAKPHHGGEGYMWIVQKNHPLSTGRKNGRIPYHWLVMYNEHPMGPEKVARLKAQCFTIHHKNGKRDDNRLANLQFRAPGRHPRGWSVDELKQLLADLG